RVAAHGLTVTGIALQVVIVRGYLERVREEVSSVILSVGKNSWSEYETKDQDPTIFCHSEESEESVSLCFVQTDSSLRSD
ncbi:MAG TPA: hypothetical protein VM409_07180, partial [Chloroflexia bacterium]|nr:hypothetical protein [Chloroflexia bacterium]